MATRVAPRCYNLLVRSPHSLGLSGCATRVLPALSVGGVRYTHSHRTGTTMDALGQRRKVKNDTPTTSSPAPRTPSARTPASPNRSKADKARALLAATAVQAPRKNAEKDLKIGLFDKTAEKKEKEKRAQPAEQKEKTVEQELEDVERLMQIAQMYPGTDIWGQEIPTLDLKIPLVVSEGASAKEKWEAWKFNKGNDLYNAWTMWQIAGSNSFPGVKIYRGGIRPGPHSVWERIRRSFRARSLEDTEWITGVRNTAYETYLNLNRAISLADTKTVKRLATSKYGEQVLKLAKSYDRPDRLFQWKMQKLNAPVEVVSIRCAEGYLGTAEPKTGSRLLIHALVKIDSTQSFEGMERRGGKVLYSNAKRVVEYLVFEKRCWYETPWVIRDQLFERPGQSRS